MLSDGAIEHLNRLWRASVAMFEAGSHALAAFLAITLIEEVGKVAILADGELAGSLDGSSFYNHRSKYRYAVGRTLVVNARVTRIYGDLETRFATWFRNDELFQVRNNSLYLGYRNGQVLTPHEIVSRQDAFLLVCIAGEAWAEIQGTYTGARNGEWERLIGEIDSFRSRNSEPGLTVV